MYKVTPLSILFPAIVTNDTKQIFITAKELRDVKKAILNGKTFDLITIVDFNKINNWSESKASRSGPASHSKIKKK